jgi:hypothetical protein
MTLRLPRSQPVSMQRPVAIRIMCSCAQLVGAKPWLMTHGHFGAQCLKFSFSSKLATLRGSYDRKETSQLRYPLYILCNCVPIRGPALCFRRSEHGCVERNDRLIQYAWLKSLRTANTLHLTAHYSKRMGHASNQM